MSNNSLNNEPVFSEGTINVPTSRGSFSPDEAPFVGKNYHILLDRFASQTLRKEADGSIDSVVWKCIEKTGDSATFKLVGVASRYGRPAKMPTGYTPPFTIGKIMKLNGITTDGFRETTSFQNVGGNYKKTRKSRKIRKTRKSRKTSKASK